MRDKGCYCPHPPRVRAHMYCICPFTVGVSARESRCFHSLTRYKYDFPCEKFQQASWETVNLYRNSEKENEGNSMTFAAFFSLLVFILQLTSIYLKYVENLNV